MILPRRERGKGREGGREGGRKGGREGGREGGDARGQGCVMQAYYKLNLHIQSRDTYLTMCKLHIHMCMYV